MLFRRLIVAVIHGFTASISMDDWSHTLNRWLRRRKWLPAWFFERPTRLDHGRMYMCVTLGLWMMALSMIVIGPLPNSTITTLSEFTQRAMAAVIFLGTSIKIHGFCSGTKYFMPHRDPRDYYAQAAWGVVATNTGLGVYVVAILVNYGGFWVSALGGAVGISIVIGSIWNAWDFNNEIYKLTIQLKDGVVNAKEDTDGPD